jgi:acyl-CoA synthetase (AMP-forming)/AMP-acid ligase II
MTKAENPSSSPIDHLARRGAPDAAALLIGDKVTTFAELDAGVGRLASWLLEQAAGRANALRAGAPNRASLA